MLEDISWWTSQEYKDEQRKKAELQRERQSRNIQHICRILELNCLTWAEAKRMNSADLLRLDGFGAISLSYLRKSPDKPRIRVKMGRSVH